jgi:hypothetical protein
MSLDWLQIGYGLDETDPPGFDARPTRFRSQIADKPTLFVEGLMARQGWRFNLPGQLRRTSFDRS